MIIHIPNIFLRFNNMFCFKDTFNANLGIQGPGNKRQTLRDR